ncbi:MAG: LD-carboxypeptidase, partial [Gammaproteobacteria bacterium]
ESRFKHLCNALTNTNSKAIWCLLGGFGATKIIPQLNQMKRPAHAKWFIGFSDITALHIFLQTRWGWSTIHGPSGYQASLNKVSNESVNILKRIMLHEDKTLSYNQLTPLNSLAQVHTVINAPIIGGNLHIIQTTLATPWQINADHKILFIEDINERAYRIDRVLAHLSHAGIFDQAKAILLGDFIDKGEPNGEYLVMKTLHEFASQCTLPVLQLNNIGHGPVNNPLILGSPVTLTTGEHSTIEFNFA